MLDLAQVLYFEWSLETRKAKVRAGLHHVFGKEIAIFWIWDGLYWKPAKRNSVEQGGRRSDRPKIQA